MPKLQCDLCGGSIIMQGGGQLAVCDSCGMQYSVERMREKAQEITGTVRIEGPVQARQTGTEDDVFQWRSLLDKYYKAGDFQAAENIVKKILEAVPSDEQANKMYDELQVLKFMEIKNGVLVSYNGQAETLVIPNCVEKIEDEAFRGNKSLKDVTISFGVKEIGRSAFEACMKLESISIPDSVQTIGNQAFCCCVSLLSIKIPANITSIGGSTFEDCGFSSITIPPSVTSIGYKAFCGCKSLSSIKVPVNVMFIGAGAFDRCSSLTQVDIPERLCDESLFITNSDDREDLWSASPKYISPWYIGRFRRALEQDRRQKGVCQHCGGRFTGLFTTKCERCGKPKDY